MTIIPQTAASNTIHFLSVWMCGLTSALPAEDAIGFSDAEETVAVNAAWHTAHSTIEPITSSLTRYDS